MSQSIRELSGKSWHEWPHTQLVEDMDALSPSPASASGISNSSGATPSSSRSHSPKLGAGMESDACMRLPRKEMSIFGQCPVQDDFVLVVCDTCHASVKIEAFSSHIRLRHQKNARFSATKACSVDLLKEDIFSLSTKPASAQISSTSSSSSSTPAVIEVTAPPVSFLEPMEVDEIKEEIKEENNVISIPDSEPLPHGMSNDLMAIMDSSEASSPTLQHPTNLIRLQVKSEPNQVNEVVMPPKKVTPPTTPTTGGGRVSKPLREYNPDKHCGVWDSDTKRHCTRALTCKSHSVLLKRKIEGRSKSFDELVTAHKKAQAEAALKNTPPVTTCIQVRPFTPTVSVTAPPSVASIKSPPKPSVNTAPSTMIGTPISVSSPTVIATTTPITLVSPPATQQKSDEESLFYTTDHPKPLAFGGFKGGRRVGGLIVAGRNHVFTRKLVRVAITAGAGSFGGGGFHRIRPRVFIGSGGATVTTIESPQHSPYVLNYNLSGNIKRPAAGSTPTANVVSVNTNSPSAPSGLNLTTLPPGGVVIPESFKTDIQDFKGGIKFELGRKIKHILPSGSEISK